MRITDAKVKKVNGSSRLKAVAEITIEGVFVVHELRVIEGNNGLFVAMPSRTSYDRYNGEEVFKDIAHPINQETREKLQTAILEAYEAPETEESAE